MYHFALFLLLGPFRERQLILRHGYLIDLRQFFNNEEARETQTNFRSHPTYLYKHVVRLLFTISEPLQHHPDPRFSVQVHPWYTFCLGLCC